MNKKPLRNNIAILLTVLIISILMILSPILFGIDIMNGGGMLILVGITAMITDVICIPIFVRRGKILNKLLNDENILVHWKYDQKYWNSYIKKEYKERKERSTALFILIGVLFLIFGIIFSIADPDTGKYLMLFIFIFIGIILAAAILSVYIFKKQNQKAGEIIICRDGVLLNKEFHCWSTVGCRLEKVYYLDKKVPLLIIQYSAFTRMGRQKYDVRIPIPEGKGDEALNVINFLSSIHESQN